MHDTLKHRIGLKESYLDIDCYDKSIFGIDFLKSTLQAEFVHKPKVDFTYTDAAFYLISRIVYKKSGMDLENYLVKKLFTPLGIKEFKFDKCPKGFSMGATGLYLKSSDTIKLPYLLLNNGIYNNERLLSNEWMSILEENEYENYYFKDSFWYAKGGMRNQVIMYNKVYDVAVAWHGDDDNFEKLLKYVLNNVKEKME